MNRLLQMTFEVEAVSNAEIAFGPLVRDCITELSLGSGYVGRMAHRTVNECGGTATVSVYVSSYLHNLIEDPDRETPEL